MTLIFHHPNYYKKLRAQARKQPTSSQAQERKPASPEPGAQASSQSSQAPGSGSQGTSESVQASGNRQQG